MSTALRKLPFTFNVPNDADGLLVGVGLADPTLAPGVAGAYAYVANSDGKRAVAWHFRCPAGAGAGIRISDGIASQGASDFETLGPGDCTTWQAAPPAPYYRVVGDGGATTVSGWALVTEA